MEHLKVAGNVTLGFIVSIFNVAGINELVGIIVGLVTLIYLYNQIHLTRLKRKIARKNLKEKDGEI